MKSPMGNVKETKRRRGKKSHSNEGKIILYGRKGLSHPLLSVFHSYFC